MLANLVMAQLGTELDMLLSLTLIVVELLNPSRVIPMQVLIQFLKRAEIRARSGSN